MSFGQFNCLGSPLQLRDKYGGGYTLTLKLKSGDGNASTGDNTLGQSYPTEDVKAFVGTHIPEATLTEENVGLLRYRLQSSRDNPRLASAFLALEAATKPATGCDEAAFVGTHIPDTTLTEENVGLLRYRLQSNSDNPRLAAAFLALEAATKPATGCDDVLTGMLQKRISDYAVNQTSLEEVFLRFANQAPVAA
eukprot:CAMPEP_0172786102 /NCGR_PEP_ID=MMETSP1074-20121228/205780_1 /TAXON_ID=2916 /ORGANISM="Ceratium fusus, Strain PA161109" /LENGTH=193 /DNA_ID=CAMNT_0013623115 /DNA_START=1 /DNA_END=582 /DNA_ORIENTATION=-